MKEEIKVDGISQFFWMAIPAVLALAGLLWFTFYMGIHDARKQISQEQRSNQAVGANPLPKDKIKVVISNLRNSCRVVDSAYLDGDDLWVYWHKACVGSDHYVTADSIAWKSLAPDGTVLGGNNEHVPSLSVGEKGEFHTSTVISDPRTATVEVRATWNDEW